MSKFTTPLIVELIGEDLWRVKEEFEYHVGTYPSEEIIRVPVGKITDFASVPKIFWSIIGPVGKHGKAAVIHDYCYGVHYKNSRKDCDDIFFEAMGILGVTWWKKWVIYISVRSFSWIVWERKKYPKNK